MLIYEAGCIPSCVNQHADAGESYSQYSVTAMSLAQLAVNYMDVSAEIPVIQKV